MPRGYTGRGSMQKLAAEMTIRILPSPFAVGGTQRFGQRRFFFFQDIQIQPGHFEFFRFVLVECIPCVLIGPLQFIDAHFCRFEHPFTGSVSIQRDAISALLSVPRYETERRQKFGRSRSIPAGIPPGDIIQDWSSVWMIVPSTPMP